MRRICLSSSHRVDCSNKASKVTMLEMACIFLLAFICSVKGHHPFFFKNLPQTGQREVPETLEDPDPLDFLVLVLVVAVITIFCLAIDILLSHVSLYVLG